MYNSVISSLEVLILTVPVLLIVAFVTVAERKTMASMQRRLGPNLVGYYGLLQAFADALKLIIKECIFPALSNSTMFFIGPILTLYFSLCIYGILTFGPFQTLVDLKLNILYLLAISSISTYGILLAG
jgi:NADH-ubiquinone oxidoreductase chain 1